MKAAILSVVLFCVVGVEVQVQAAEGKTFNKILKFPTT